MTDEEQSPDGSEPSEQSQPQEESAPPKEEYIKCPICGHQNPKDISQCTLCTTKLVAPTGGGRVGIKLPEDKGETFLMIDLEDPYTRKQLEALTLIPGVSKRKALYLYKSGITSLQEFIEKAFAGDRRAANFSRIVVNKLLVDDMKKDMKKEVGDSITCTSCGSQTGLETGNCMVCGFELEKEMETVNLEEVKETLSGALEDLVSNLGSDEDFMNLPDDMVYQVASILDDESGTVEDISKTIESLGDEFKSFDMDSEGSTSGEGTETAAETDEPAAESTQEHEKPSTETAAETDGPAAESTQEHEKPSTETAAETDGPAAKSAQVTEVQTAEPTTEEDILPVKPITEPDKSPTEPGAQPSAEPTPEQAKTEAQAGSSVGTEQTGTPVGPKEILKTSTEKLEDASKPPKEIVDEFEKEPAPLKSKEERKREILVAKIQKWYNEGYDVSGLYQLIDGDLGAFKEAAKEILKKGKIT